MKCKLETICYRMNVTYVKPVHDLNDGLIRHTCNIGVKYLLTDLYNFVVSSILKASLRQACDIYVNNRFVFSANIACNMHFGTHFSKPYNNHRNRRY